MGNSIKALVPTKATKLVVLHYPTFSSRLILQAGAARSGPTSPAAAGPSEIATSAWWQPPPTSMAATALLGYKAWDLDSRGLHDLKPSVQTTFCT